MWVAVLLVFFVVIISLYLDTRKPKDFPPGPLWLPLVGSALSVQKIREKHGGYLFKACNELAKLYSPDHGVLGLKVGKDRIVMVCGLESIKESLLNEDLDGRPTGLFYETRTWGERCGIIMTDGEVWKEQRRFIMKHLREFGFGRKGMGDIATSEAGYIIHDLLDKLDDTNKVVLPMHDFFNTYVLNTLWRMMAGIRYSAKDPEMQYLNKLMYELFSAIDMVGTIFSHFPLLRFVIPEMSGYKSFVSIHERIWAFLRDELDKHKNKFSTEQEDKDFMDVYIRALNSGQKDSSYSEGQLVATCMDMFMAGTETTSKSLGFCFLYLLRNEEVQRKAQDEIDRVVGRDRLPTLEDRQNMPYTEAVVAEAVRHFMGRTFGIPHRALQQSKLGPYTIPKDTMVVSNFPFILMDEKLFPEAASFKPERFLEGESGASTAYFPFGIGRHRCLGEVLARCNMFVFCAAVLQRFSVKPVPASPPPDPDRHVDGATAAPPPYHAMLVPRY